ncbi:MAG: hypothetical protein ACTTJH_01950 [Bacteroidales bacterium]
MYFKQDKILNGFATSLSLTLISGFIILSIQKILHIDVLINAKMYLFATIPQMLILRQNVKQNKYKAVKGSILSLVLTLGIVIAILIKYHYLELVIL